MATITTLQTGDNGSTSRTVINTNLTNLNTDKIETSYLDTDVTLAADSDTKVATQKATKAYVDGIIQTSVEITTGVTHSLTTTAGQVVCVWAKGNITSTLNGTGNFSPTLKYGAVQKDIVSSGVDSDGVVAYTPFSLMYTETPGNATADITVTAGTTLENVVIMVQIIG
jgi:hypothetical protein